MATTEIMIEFYALENGKKPFVEWHKNLRNERDKKRIIDRVQRIKHGNYGDCKSVGEGVFEMRYFFSSGYRVYFGRDGDRLILILCGGDKDSQEKDIKKAKEYWRDYNENKEK